MDLEKISPEDIIKVRQEDAFQDFHLFIRGVFD